MSRVLVIEDDALMSATLVATVKGLGHEVESASSAELGLEKARARPPALVLLDLHLPGRSGLDTIPDLLRLAPRPLVVLLTAHPTAENAIDAMARGASAHLAKPVDPDELEALVEKLLAEPAAPRRAAPAAPAPPDDGSPRLVGRSAAILDLARRVGALARTDTTVLIRGESGTGKELVARAIHARSARAAGPFVAVNCATLPDDLFESELFGHEKGAFTGAVKGKAGRVERADGGTLFLDEVAELSPRAQAKLLRFLEDRSVERVGGEAPRAVDLRVLTATNAPLEARVAAGSFREDLYYRLDVVTLELPPLRARREDLPLLVEHLLARAGRADVRLDSDAAAALAERGWPGNVRELKNVVEAALVAVGPGRLLQAEHLPAAGRPGAAQPEAPTPAAAPGPGTSGERALAEALRRRVHEVLGQASPGGEAGPELFDRVRADVERLLIAAALEATGGNQVAAAKLLDMNRATLRRKMATYGLR